MDLTCSQQWGQISQDHWSQGGSAQASKGHIYLDIAFFSLSPRMSVNDNTDTLPINLEAPSQTPTENASQSPKAKDIHAVISFLALPHSRLEL